MGLTSAQVIRECQDAFNPSRYFKATIEAAVKSTDRSDKGFNRRMKKANKLKIGHGGTLDPLATGVLILGIGSGTKSLPQFLDCIKTYEATIVFGAATDTYDRVGRVLARRSYDHITKDKVLEALESFKGKQTQIPPLYSALKMNGKPLYEYAREGRPIPREIEGREVEVSALEMLEWYEPGTHNHRWPIEEAEAAERNLAEQVWRVKKQQETTKKLTPEEKEEDDQAVAAHENFKRKFEEKQDTLIRDSPSNKKRRHNKSNKEGPMMSGALGQMPRKGSELMEDCRPADPSTPPPWTGKGPPAMKVRMSVSSGFYVRSFCHDLGAKLNSAALMAELCRTRQSDFTVGGLNTLEFSDIKQDEAVWAPKISNMLSRWNGEPEAMLEATSKPKERPDKGDEEGAASTTPPRESVETDTREMPAEAESPRTHRPQPLPRKRARSRSHDRSSSPGRNVKAKTDREVSPAEKSWNGIQD